MRPNLIAFTGYAGTGKDEAAKTLIVHGYTRVAFGDIIKGVFDDLVKRFLGFSAFTEDREKKMVIRPLLEQGGEVFYDYVFNTFFDSLPKKAVNTRLCRVREAEEWVRRGGVIIEVRRKGVGPSTDWERAQLDSLRERGLVFCVLQNDSDLDQLQERVIQMFELFRQAAVAA